jgi:transglutaminase-like putative cysteine protease
METIQAVLAPVPRSFLYREIMPSFCVMSTDMDIYLKPTECIESAHPAIAQAAETIARGCRDDVERVVKLFTFVRDAVRYNIFMISMFPEDFRATFILEHKQGYCVQKAVLLAALQRALPWPAEEEKA